MTEPRPSRLINIFRTPLEGFNQFILADLREGRLSLAGLSFSYRVLVYIGFTILISAALLTIFFEPIRQNSDLVTLQNSNLLLCGSSVATLTSRGSDIIKERQDYRYKKSE